MCRNAKPKVGSIEQSEEQRAEATTNQAGDQSQSRPTAFQQTAFIQSTSAPASSAPQSGSNELQFLGKFNEAPGSDDDDLMCLSIETKQAKSPNVEQVVKLSKRVSHLLYEKDRKNENKCIDVIVRAENCFIKLTVDTGSPSSFINKFTADSLVADASTGAKFIPVKLMKHYITHIDYNDKRINILGEVVVRITSAEWEVKEARFLVVEKARCLLGLDLHSKLGIRTSQISKSQWLAENQSSTPPVECNALQKTED